MVTSSNSAFGLGQGLPSAKKGRYTDADLREVSRQFEAMYTAQMLKTMNKSIERSDLVPRSMGESVFRDMLMDQYAKKMSEGEGLGLSDLIYKTLRRDKSLLGVYQNKLREYRKNRHLSFELMENMAGDFGKVEHYKRPVSVDARMEKLDPLIRNTAHRHGVDPHLVRAVIRRESGGNATAVSKAGAKGLMQLMDSTAADWGVRNVYDTRQNVEGGVRYLKHLLQRFDGELEKALAAYNAGPANVEKYKGIPPFPETRRYIQSVMNFRERYARQEKEAEHAATH